MPKTWSNRQGVCLTPITTGVWAAERPFIWNGIDVGGRSLIVRMSDGRLLVHSPVEWTHELGRCIEGLGEVGCIVSPNYEHVKYAKQWAEKYPSADVYACPGLAARKEDVRWTGELKGGDAVLGDTVATVWFDCEVNPFTDKPFFNEVAFFHKPSSTFFCADVFWNYPAGPRPNYDGVTGTGLKHNCPKVMTPPLDGDHLPEVDVPFGTKLWKFGMDVVYAPFYRRLMVGEGERRYRYEDAVHTLLSWEPEIIAPCHGDVIRGKDLCQRVLKEHFLP